MSFNNKRTYFKNSSLILILAILSLVFTACTATENSLNNSSTSDIENANNLESNVEEKNTDLDNNNLNISNSNNKIEDKSTKDSNTENKIESKETVKDNKDTNETLHAEQSTNDGNENNEEEIKELTFNSITFDKLHPLTLEPAKPFTDREISFRNHDFPTIGTYYSQSNKWRFQVVEAGGYGSKPKVVVDIGNTGDKPLVLTDKNLCFVLMAASGGSGNIAGSKLHDAPVTINPGEIKRVTITASNPEARALVLKFSGEEFVEIGIRDYNEKIEDTKPYENNDEFGLRVGGTTGDYYPEVSSLRTLAGNGKFKFLAKEVIITDLKQVGGIKKTKEGAILLVKVVIANTTEETMKINWVATQAVRLNKENKFEEYEYTKKEWKALGSKALPRIIKPKQIVEGYIAVPFFEGRNNHAILFKSTHGRFVIGDIETLPVSP
jgi:hypothetical protein